LFLYKASDYNPSNEGIHLVTSLLLPLYYSLYDIYKDIPITTTVKTITVYIWLDGNLVTEQNQNEILSSVYKGHISMDIKSGDK